MFIISQLVFINTQIDSFFFPGAGRRVEMQPNVTLIYTIYTNCIIKVASYMLAYCQKF